MKIMDNFYLHIKVEPEPIGCSSDFECSPTQACRNRNCVNPCTNDKPCSSTAICTVKNHRSTCKCLPGFDGDPYKTCNKSKTDNCLSF